MSHLLGQLNSFGGITAFDYEFVGSPGSRPDSICLVSQDCRSGEVKRYSKDDLHKLRECPFPVGPNDLVVAYFASAELSCMLELGWQLPHNVIDLFAEHRVRTNGLYLPAGNGLLGALALRGLPHMEVVVKDAVRDKIIRHASWSPQEQAEILDYCESDVRSLSILLTAMLPNLDVARALLRGRYMKAVARMERAGIPIDTDLLQSFRESWKSARWELVRSIDADYGVYDGLTFKRGRFSEWLRTHKIPWPRSESGGLKLDDDTFKEQVAIWPILKPLRELRQAIHGMYLPHLPVGEDGRNRTLLAPFASKTGRNQIPQSALPLVWRLGSGV